MELRYLTFIGVSLGLCVPGCGPVIPVQKEGAPPPAVTTTDPLNAEKLGLTLFPSNGAVRIKAENNEIAFEKPIQLPSSSSEEVYLAWPENSLGDPLVQATYSHEIMDSQNKRVHRQGSIPARHHPGLRLWKIPLRALLTNYPSSPADTHILMVQLLLESGQHFIFTVKFRLERT